eukprot:TRINITY_DN11899_c1_g1_i2.p1 TRINITY_DN11899_c1_g1~~TRINITY_DN11899_c1_g1_i2.p1  ORF type:complete len:355 (+),score=43.84 TRINITY_DN11899_c1_g1_i2:186-1250(+)
MDRLVDRITDWIRGHGTSTLHLINKTNLTATASAQLVALRGSENAPQDDPIGGPIEQDVAPFAIEPLVVTRNSPFNVRCNIHIRLSNGTWHEVVRVNVPPRKTDRIIKITLQEAKEVNQHELAAIQLLEMDRRGDVEVAPADIRVAQVQPNDDAEPVAPADLGAAQDVAQVQADRAHELPPAHAAIDARMRFKPFEYVRDNVEAELIQLLRKDAMVAFRSVESGRFLRIYNSRYVDAKGGGQVDQPASDTHFIVESGAREGSLRLRHVDSGPGVYLAMYLDRLAVGNGDGDCELDIKPRHDSADHPVLTFELRRHGALFSQLGFDQDGNAMEPSLVVEGADQCILEVYVVDQVL